jgi:hypothetical protein
MSEKKQAPEIEVKDYAGGWITEKKGTEVPPFLKLAFPVIGLSCTAYLVVYMNGETTHSDRGALVQAFNKVTGGADSLMFLVAALALVFVVTVVLFSVRKSH